MKDNIILNLVSPVSSAAVVVGVFVIKTKTGSFGKANALKKHLILKTKTRLLTDRVLQEN